MRIDILTLFPDMFNAVLGESIIKRAVDSKKIKICIHNIRDYSKDRHKKVDAKPFGGGPGMVMCVQPILDALKHVKKMNNFAYTVLMSPQGKTFTQKEALILSRKKGIILLCGHYEGIDERIKCMIDSEISIGDYVLTGGELPAMVIVDALARLIPGVLGHKDSCKDESFFYGLLEYPHYTRPAVYNKMKVPEELLSGNHKAIRVWRWRQSIRQTIDKRPDLINNIRQIEIPNDLAPFASVRKRTRQKKTRKKANWRAK